MPDPIEDEFRQLYPTLAAIRDYNIRSQQQDAMVVLGLDPEIPIEQLHVDLATAAAVNRIAAAETHDVFDLRLLERIRSERDDNPINDRASLVAFMLERGWHVHAAGEGGETWKAPPNGNYPKLELVPFALTSDSWEWAGILHRVKQEQET